MRKAWPCCCSSHEINAMWGKFIRRVLCRTSDSNKPTKILFVLAISRYGLEYQNTNFKSGAFKFSPGTITVSVVLLLRPFGIPRTKFRQRVHDKEVRHPSYLAFKSPVTFSFTQQLLDSLP
ncbi:hypothetical protein J6590_012021 [Homalodisca vitripennis]|nr:hypothetical protein J6590_012021 [Homalodisca vitripennis]